MSQIYETYLWSDFNVSNIHFDKPKIPAKGDTTTKSTTIKMLYKDPEKGLVNPTILCPSVKCPYGLQKYGPAEYGSKWGPQISISYTDYKTDSNMKGFYNFVNKLNDSVFNYLLQNSTKLFKKKLSKDALECYYTSLIKHNLDSETGLDKWPPTTNLTIYYKDETMDITVRKVLRDKDGKLQKDDNNNPLSEIVSHDQLDTALPKHVSITPYINFRPIRINIDNLKTSMKFVTKELYLNEQQNQSNSKPTIFPKFEEKLEVSSDHDEDSPSSDVQTEMNNYNNDSCSEEESESEDEINEAMAQTNLNASKKGKK